MAVFDRRTVWAGARWRPSRVQREDRIPAVSKRDLQPPRYLPRRPPPPPPPPAPQPSLPQLRPVDRVPDEASYRSPLRCEDRECRCHWSWRHVTDMEAVPDESQGATDDELPDDDEAPSLEWLLFSLGQSPHWRRRWEASE